MKKFLIIFFLAALILVPPIISAFPDIVNFGKGLLHKRVQLSREEIKEQIAAEAEQLYTYEALEKYNKWRWAFDQRELSLVFNDYRNFYFTEEEMNYLVARELAISLVPPARDIRISFTEDLIRVSGTSTIKYLSGPFYLEIKPAEKDGRVGFKIIKAYYGKIRLPAFFAQSLFDKETKEALKFLYSDLNRQDLSLTVGSGFMELNYGR